MAMNASQTRQIREVVAEIQLENMMINTCIGQMLIDFHILY